LIRDGIRTPSTSGVAAASAQKAECHGEDAHDAGRHDDIETETKLHIKFSDVDRLVALVEFC